MDKHNKMLIDATHPEETRVVVLRNGRIEEFDYESASRKLLRGNIYLAKVTRVEPSLQAAFVDYGGNRHGFLAFSEIHPDYYQIPIADRELLKQEEAEEEARLEAEVEERATRRNRRGSRDRGGHRRSGAVDAEHGPAPGTGDQPDWPGPSYGRAMRTELPVAEAEPVASGDEPAPPAIAYAPDDERRRSRTEPLRHDVEPGSTISAAASNEELHDAPAHGDASGDRGRWRRRHADESRADDENGRSGGRRARHSHDDDLSDVPEPVGNVEDVGVVEVDAAGDDNGVGGDNGEADHIEEVTTEEDALEEVPERPRRRMRQYKIQEVIKRRQIILVQVVKEERGNKGAALTTYISLAGRYTVLMPNTGRGGGISRKITQPQDRKRLKAIAEELDVPEGMGLIVRTAGAARTKQEIKRDYEYLLRLWESVRELTLSSMAPCLVYEEGNLIKRSIRDLYSKDIDQVAVAGSAAWREAHDFMGMLMPEHADNVTRYEGSEPLFTRFGIERQLNAMFSPYVTLRSGGYLVINQTEALVAIDVNSGKATREFSIEETALNTNLEAAEEIARQLKLRDLAGLIVVDFIDMEEKRNNRSVERRLKDALRNDRARIQVGRISHFGLLEMSRQRLRTGVLEGSTSQCPHCQGTGIIRSTESVALGVLRGLEDALMKQPGSLVATTTATVALYILNNKRSFIVDMEQRHGITVAVEASDRMQGANFSIDRVAGSTAQPAKARASGAVSMDWGFDDDGEGDVDVGADEAAAEPRRGNGNGSAHGAAHAHREPAREMRDEDERGDGEDGGQEARSGRRRRRRRGRRDRDGNEGVQAGQPHQPLGEDTGGNGHATAHAASADADFGDERETLPAAEPGGHDGDEQTTRSQTDDGDGGEAHQPGQDDRPRRGRRRGRRGGRGRGREQGAEAGGELTLGLGEQPDVVTGGGWTTDQGSSERRSIIEFVPRRDEPAVEHSTSFGIVEMAEAGNGASEPVAPIPAYPRAASSRWPDVQRQAPSAFAAGQEPDVGSPVVSPSMTGPVGDVEAAPTWAPQPEAPPVAAVPQANAFGTLNGSVNGSGRHDVDAPASGTAAELRPDEQTPVPHISPAAESVSTSAAAEPTPPPPSGRAEEPAQPPRRGWWQRRFGG